ncbi:hypothetical protein K439DRAFT_445015 [Ramaria rubella]|nr:hypothetical protein K439DRAFT_445015 [Ramaria rubella]
MKFPNVAFLISPWCLHIIAVLLETNVYSYNIISYLRDDDLRRYKQLMRAFSHILMMEYSYLNFPGRSYPTTNRVNCNLCRPHSRVKKLCCDQLLHFRLWQVLSEILGYVM